MVKGEEPRMRADLHLHSRYSDGWDWPAAVAARAAAAGLEYAALADHDSMEGVGEFLEACGRRGLAAVPAAEVDCTAPEVGFDGEILVYFPGGRFEGMAAFLRERLREREERMRRLVERARALHGGGAPSFEELGRFKAGGEEPGERLLAYAVVDLFECLKHRGVLPPRADYRAFKAALTTGDAQPKPHARDVIARARAEGGYAALAHPAYAAAKDPRPSPELAKRLGELFAGLGAWGLWGAELYLYQGSDTEGLNRLVREQAAPAGLRFTYGSDCHGPGSPHQKLGRFSGEFPGFGPEGETS